MKAALAFCIFLFPSACLAFGGGKPEEPKPTGVKRVVRVSPLVTKYIELDDGAKYGMGENLYNRLVTRLHESGSFVVVVNEPWQPKISVRAGKPEAPTYDPTDRLHFEFAPIPAADFEAQVSELSFTHGSRGVKRYAGFGTNFTTPFNDGRFENKNEFPPRALDFVSGWFGTSFDAIGDGINSTIAGVDAGEEGEFNVVVAKLSYRRDSYLATAKVEAAVRLLAENETRKSILDASGKGFLLAIGAGYRELSVELGIAKRDALKQTFDKTVEKMAAEIHSQLFTIPFRTKIEKIGSEGIIVNAGRREGIKVGDVFLHKAQGKIVLLQAKEVFLIGSRVEPLAAGAELSAGDVIVHDEKAVTQPTLPSDQVPENREASVPNPVVKAETKSIVIDPPEFSDPDGNVEKGLSVKGLLLPILLWRWSQYDQEIKKEELKPRGDIFAAAAARWNLRSIRAAEAWSRGVTGKGVKIAVIDSGVDYNHENLAHAVPRDYPGFDFLSFDPRPFDDNSHGTAVAGIIGAQALEKNQVGIAPDAKILSYKVFDPYGQTTSAALYGAVRRAIDDGAKILLLAWDTRKESEALAEAARLAEQKGVLLVTAAGDQGEDIRNTAHFPARYNALPNLVVTASLDESGRLATESGRWSNYGNGAVDIAAPGAGLEVLAPRGNYLKRSGTDLAAAHVAAAAALVWQAHPEATAKEIKDRLLNGAKRDPALAEKITEGRVLDASAAAE